MFFVCAKSWQTVFRYKHSLEVLIRCCHLVCEIDTIPCIWRPAECDRVPHSSHHNHSPTKTTKSSLIMHSLKELDTNHEYKLYTNTTWLDILKIL